MKASLIFFLALFLAVAVAVNVEGKKRYSKTNVRLISPSKTSPPKNVTHKSTTTSFVEKMEDELGILLGSFGKVSPGQSSLWTNGPTCGCAPGNSTCSLDTDCMPTISKIICAITTLVPEYSESKIVEDLKILRNVICLLKKVIPSLHI